MDKLAVAVSGKAFPTRQLVSLFLYPVKYWLGPCACLSSKITFVFCSFWLDLCLCLFLLSQRPRESVLEWQNNPA